MSVQIISWLSGVTVLAISILVENFSKSFKPWSIILRKLGKLINAENFEKLGEIERRLEKLEESDSAQSKEQGETRAKDARRRIISFADRIRRGEYRHSHESYDNVLEDITFYKKYCDDHTDFQNEKAVCSIRIVEEEYYRCLKENDFL